MEETKVTRKGQVTIPATFRKKLHIREGTKMIVEQTERGLLFTPVRDLKDLAGIDSGRYDVKGLKAELDGMRERWR